MLRHRPATRTLRADRIAPGAVEFTGSVPYEDLVASYGSADVFVCLSEHEGFCVPVIEAIGAGLPVGPGCCGAAETVGDAGLLLTDPGPAEVAAAIEAVLDDPSAASMAERGRIRAAHFALIVRKRSCAGSSARFWSRWRDVGRPSCSRAGEHDATGTHTLLLRDPLVAHGAGPVRIVTQVPTTTAEVTLVDGWTDPAELVILQHGIGSFVAEAVIHQRVPCVLNYHNITPAGFSNRGTGRFPACAGVAASSTNWCRSRPGRSPTRATTQAASDRFDCPGLARDVAARDRRGPGE